MKRLRRAFLTTLLIMPAAFAQSDDDLLDKVRANAVKIYLEQASFTLPKTFLESGLAPSEKEGLIEQWANESADCHADALLAYASSNDISLSTVVPDDGTYGFEPHAADEWRLHLESCLAESWEAVGARLPQ